MILPVGPGGRTPSRSAASRPMRSKATSWNADWRGNQKRSSAWHWRLRSREPETCPRFGLLTPHFMALPPMLASSELIAIVPDLLTPIFRGAGLVVCPLPYPAKSSAVQLVWHRHASADAAHTWFRSVLLNIARECVDERA